jgi:site-specific recombinase XerD
MEIDCGKGGRKKMVNDINKCKSWLIKNSISKSTSTQYETLWEMYQGFTRKIGEIAIPSKPKTIELFLSYLFEIKKGSFARRAKAAISYIHIKNGMNDPTKTDTILKLVKSIEKNWAIMHRKKQIRKPFPLSALINWCKNLNSSERIMKAALVSIGFRGMLRPSELSNLNTNSVQVYNGKLKIKLGITKTDRTGDEYPTIIDSCRNKSICPVYLLNKMMLERNKEKLNKKNLFILNGRPLNYTHINNIVKEMAKESGFTEGMSGHSLRIGGATQAAHTGVSELDIMCIGRWKSDSFRRYIRPIAVGSKGVSNKIFMSSN